MLVIPAFWRQEFKVIVETHSELKANHVLKREGRKEEGEDRRKAQPGMVVHVDNLSTRETGARVLPQL